jgi:mono/diheme cytochrome c family protein
MEIASIQEGAKQESKAWYRINIQQGHAMMRVRRLWGPSLGPSVILVLAAIFSQSVSGATVQDTGKDLPKSGKQLYLAACSSCHGSDGAGASRSRVGFDEDLPDFTDCNFATREPDADWVVVAHEGGPIRGFSNRMPAFGDALSVGELELVISHIRGFCTSDAWPRGELNLPRPLVTEKAFPEDETVWTTGIDLEGPGAVENEIVFEKRFWPRSQLEISFPFGWFKEEQWKGGVGDIGLGMKHVLWDSLDNGSILGLTGEVLLPTGNKERGFGKGTTVFEGFATYGQLLPSEFFLHAQAGVEVPASKASADDEVFWRGVLGRTFTQGQFGRAWSPMCEVLGARELGSDHEVKWDLVPQFQVALNTRQHIMFNVGFRIPVTDTDHRHTAILFYLFWEWFDGGLFEGW